MKKALILTLFLYALLISEGVAQAGFKQGYIISVQNDTIHGEIDYRSTAQNYQSCRFKKENSITEYTPSQLLGYRFYKDKYFTAQVKEGSFVEILVRGDLSLFKHETDFYIQKSEGDIHKLESKENTVEKDGKRIVIKDSKWKGIISYLTLDCNHYANPLQRLKLDDKSLSQFVINYNKCKGAEYTRYKAEKAGPELDFGVVAGLTRSFVETGHDMNIMGYYEDYLFSFDPYIGLVFALSVPEFSEKFILQSELHLFKSTFSSSVVLDKYLQTEHHDAFIDITSMSVPLSLKYSMTETKIPLFFQLGMNYTYNLKRESMLISTRVHKFEEKTTITEEEAFNMNRPQFGFITGIGVEKSFKKLKSAVELRYIPAIKTHSALETTKIDRLSLSLMLFMQ